MQKRKQSNKKDFEKRIKVWTLLIPLITCFIGSFVTLGITYLSNRSKIEYKIEENDQLEANKLAAQINLLCRKFFQTNNQDERERLNAELNVLAQEEATVMRKYNPNYRPRWPILIEPLPIEPREVVENPRYFLRPIFLIIYLLLTIFASISAYTFLRQRYRRKQMDVQLLEALRIHHELRDKDIADLLNSEVVEYSIEEVKKSLQRLENEKKVAERDGRWHLKDEV
jgi:hypothetical protein